MPYYRIYTLNEEGHFLTGVSLECADDLEVLDKATQLVDGHDVEVWQGARKVALITKDDIAVVQSSPRAASR